MKRLVFCLGLIGFYLMPQTSEAQIISPADDGIIPDDPKHYHNNKVFEYPYLREADMLWSTRHWERIDLRQKMNLHLYYPEKAIPDRKSLYDVIIDGILVEGTIVEVFGDDRFEIPLSVEQVLGYVEMNDTIRDPDTGEILLVDPIRIRSKDVKFWEIKSDWYFDKQRGEMKNRIIGISPVVENPKTLDRYNLFWVWFPDARYALATHVAFNGHNNSSRLTYDQVFHLRFFDSVIFKEDNVFDRQIEEYKRSSTLDQLLEAERIKNNLRNLEAELWEY
ncbi:type IX secretion system ring subunit PorN/GldN [Croceimicrobium hydrocarbonivorans]|uniref:Gliding motility protein GldN n=1 Tax=Croceimicrobium hydrocarbonivorans TaxID=2761580 RepID=A0A7H0VI50_9FLAO|nr:gliding motility protein GldN [Croceimicrobium hydrocarbonivorans]QNR25398.1 gliding motility protein GldN [Croceimicrobium hydrocarbonivorans]